MWKRPQFLFLLPIIILSFNACSSSQPSDDPMLEAELGSTGGSSADSVGSIPEDMLAADEQKADIALPSSDGSSTTAETVPESDPFKDLKDKEQEASADTSDSESSGSTGNIETYTVKPGDTLMKISFTLYGDIDRWKEIFDMNKGVIKKASRLKAGMQIKYDAPSSSFSPEQLGHTYEIKQGDTLANIADEVYGRKMKYKKLQKYNSKLIKNPNRIFAGFTLFYDITEQEVAEAEARRKERMAGGGDAVPSMISPPPQNLSPPPPAVGLAPPPPPPQNMAPPPPPPPPPQAAPAQ